MGLIGEHALKGTPAGGADVFARSHPDAVIVPDCHDEREVLLEQFFHEGATFTVQAVGQDQLNRKALLLESLN